MRRTLRWLVAGTTSAVALSLLIPLALLVQTLAADRAVSAASREASRTAALVAALPPDADVGATVQLLDPGASRRVSVQLPDGRLLGEPLPSGADGAAAAAQLARAASGEAFTVLDDGPAAAYVPAVVSGGTAVVRVELPPSELRRGVGTALAVLAALAVLLLAVAVGVAEALARRVSAPLVELAAAAHRIRQGDLNTRVRPAGPPEVAELGRALNELAARIGELLVAEREAVADLAHRLRTPVTALRLAGESLPGGDGERVRGYVADLERSVDGIVRDARRPLRSAMAARCDAVAVVTDRVDFWRALAEDSGIDLRLDAGVASAPVGVEGADLADALDALLDNAFAHATGARTVTVRVAAGPGVTEVSVDDDGPGLPPDALARGVSGAGGTGLGLDIAARTARAGGGALTVGRSAAGGARVQVSLASLAG
jgi:signal transduction histidine kinase